MERSPYFIAHQEMWDIPLNLKGESLRNDNSTGDDVLFYHFSEVNFVDYYQIKFRIDQAFDRLKSRFLKILNYFGNIFIDSSAAAEGSLVEDLIKEYPVNMLVVRDPIWVIKSSLGIYFNHPDENGNTSFQVYTGDNSRDPFIITNESQKSSIDTDKILDVPNELKDRYESNIELALQNSAGVGTFATNTFFKDKDKLKNAYKFPNIIPEVVLVDFYDDDELINYVRAQVLKIPESKILCCGIDMGVTGDRAGFALSYLDDYVYKEGKITNEFKTVTPLAIGISRKPGQETSITKIFNLIIDINELREIGLVVTDQYQSTQLRQDLTRRKIWTYLSSGDRSTEPYIFYKLQVYKGYQVTVNNQLLYREQKDLIDTGKMIDHSESGIDSKDISDAVVNSVYNINLNQELFSQISGKYAYKIQEQIVENYQDDYIKIQNEISNRTW